jgi:hypothetical protein
MKSRQPDFLTQVLLPGAAEKVLHPLKSVTLEKSAGHHLERLGHLNKLFQILPTHPRRPFR